MRMEHSMRGRRTSERRSLIDVCEFAGSAIGLWAMCAFGIYLIQPAEPVDAEPVRLVSQTLASADAAPSQLQP